MPSGIEYLKSIIPQLNLKESGDIFA